MGAATLGTRPTEAVFSEGSTAEQHGAFLAQVARREEELERATETVLGEVATPRARQFARDLTRLFREAQWLNATGHFPNGKPLQQQGPLQVAVWELFLSAINQRTYGGSNETGASDDPEFP